MPGTVRSFHFPLNREWFEYPALSAPVTRVRMSYDDTLLFVAGEDGALVVFEVRECFRCKRPNAFSRRHSPDASCLVECHCGRGSCSLISVLPFVFRLPGS